MARHIACLSGGLDSSIMALILTGFIPGGPLVDGQVEFAFTDPRKEHPNTYLMLDTLEKILGSKIVRLHGPTWEDALEANAWFLPYHRARWCPRVFKIRPFEAYVGSDKVTSYIGLRADEPERKGYLGDSGTNITPRYILREMGITRDDIEQEARRIGLPPTGKWSCSCCPFKPIMLQLEMIEQFPDAAEWMAWVEAEKERRGAGGYTWNRTYPMRELIDNPTTRRAIRRRYWATHNHDSQLSMWDEEVLEGPCLMCRVK